MARDTGPPPEHETPTPEDQRHFVVFKPDGYLSQFVYNNRKEPLKPVSALPRRGDDKCKPRVSRDYDRASGS